MVQASQEFVSNLIVTSLAFNSKPTGAGVTRSLYTIVNSDALINN